MHYAHRAPQRPSLTVSKLVALFSVLLMSKPTLYSLSLCSRYCANLKGNEFVRVLVGAHLVDTKLIRVDYKRERNKKEKSKRCKRTFRCWFH